MNLTEIENLARHKIEEHGLHGWEFKFDHAKRRLGSCHYRTKTISLSRNIFHHPDVEILNVVLHEIAHALAGPKAAHGPRWKETARQIGCDGARLSKLTLVEAPLRTLRCNQCHHKQTVRRFRLPKWLTQGRGRCSFCRVGKIREMT